MISEDLNQLGVMVTRPAHQAEPLCQLIEAAGGRVFRFPVLAIEPPDDIPASRAQLAQLTDFDLAIFISPNAVSRAKALLPDGLPKSCRLVVVGQGTARQLVADFGRQPDVVPEAGFNSEALLAMPALQDVAGQRIMILRGEGGRALLGDILGERGAELIYATVYKRVKPATDTGRLQQAIENQAIEVIVISSGEGLENLLQMVGETYRQWLCSMPLVLVNQRLKALAERLGFTGELLIADNASDKAILTCLQNRVRHK